MEKNRSIDKSSVLIKNNEYKTIPANLYDHNPDTKSQNSSQPN